MDATHSRFRIISTTCINIYYYVISPHPPIQASMRTNSTVSVALPLAELNVRATEYTVGDHGPKKMPAPLPANSGYTYCIELSADEAIKAGAKTVRFEPGQEREIEVVALAGKRQVFGFNAKIMGSLER